MNKPVSQSPLDQAAQRAIARSLTEDYKGCYVHVNCINIRHVILDGLDPVFALSEWYGTETVMTFVNGKETS